MIAGAVTYDCNSSFIHRVQQLDMASLQGATIGSLVSIKVLCNGANLAYKITFTTLNGFDGNDKIANCDDVLLRKPLAAFLTNYITSNQIILL
jgi:hypothetical protein